MHRLSAGRASGILLWSMACMKFLFALLAVHPVYELHRDELLYVAEAQHLAWGYLEAPPFLSLLAWISALLGNGELVIRCWPALLGALTFLIAGKMVLRSGGRNPALFLLFLAFIFSAFLRAHFLFQPNFLDIFFWTLIMYWVFCYIQGEDPKFIYLLGITAGLGFLSKYSIGILLFALAAALAFSPQRKLFAERHAYVALIIGFLIFLPNLIWQYQHNFPVLNHMEELHETQLRHIRPIGFLVDQLLMTLPVCFIWLTGLGYVLYHPGGKRYRVFGWTFLFVLGLLLLLKGKAYYALGAYPVLLAMGALRLEEIIRIRPWLRYAGIGFILLTGIPMIPVLLPIWTPERLAGYYRFTGLDRAGILQWEDLQDHDLPQDFADMLGRNELSRKTAAAFDQVPAWEQAHTVLFCDNYGQAGALNYYGRADLPPAISASASFLLWIPQYDHIRHLIWVGDPPPEEAELWHAFEEVRVLDSVTTPMSRESGTRITWFRNADTSFTGYFHSETGKMQQRFRRQRSFP